MQRGTRSVRWTTGAPLRRGRAAQTGSPRARSSPPRSPAESLALEGPEDAEVLVGVTCSCTVGGAVAGAAGGVLGKLAAAAAPAVRRGAVTALGRVSDAAASAARTAASGLRSRIAAVVASGDRGSINFSASAGQGAVSAKTAEAAADVALGVGRTTGAAAELTLGDRVHGRLDRGRAQDEQRSGAAGPACCPPPQRAPWHGACAEVGCLSQTLDAGVDPAGGTMRAVAIGTSDPGHGLPKMSCSDLLDTLGAGR